MSERTFEECVKKVKKITNLEKLFELWRKAHIAEVEEIKEKLHAISSDDDKKTFEEILYKNKKINGEKHYNTISSHFVQFFNKAKCQKGCFKFKAEEAWEYVLKNAFNMDGCYGTFDVKKGGYKYICLLKEANDSKKVCVRNYEPDIRKCKINEWIMQEKKDASMLNILNEAFKIFYMEKEKSKSPCEDFTEEMAYMNLNKRGGTSSTQGYNQTAVVNYASKYRRFILKEIEILAAEQEEVTVFICGKSDDYGKKLINILVGEDKEDDIEPIGTNKIQYKGKLMKFVNITHPSPPGIKNNKSGYEQLAKEMQKG